MIGTFEMKLLTSYIDLLDQGLELNLPAVQVMTIVLGNKYNEQSFFDHFLGQKCK